MSDYYAMDDYREGAPYAIYRKGGVVHRLETRNGQLVDIVERVEPKCYGVPRENLHAVERPKNPPQNHGQNGRARKRLARLIRITRYLKRHRDVTKREIAERFGISVATAWHDLAVLRQDGKAVDTRSSNGRYGQAEAVWNAPD